MHHGKISKPIADGLIALRSRIEQGGIPSSKLDETLNLATWNIREFGKKARSEAAVHYKDKLAFTFLMSDHLPLWVQINTDNDNFVLEQISKGYRGDAK